MIFLLLSLAQPAWAHRHQDTTRPPQAVTLQLLVENRASLLNLHIPSKKKNTPKNKTNKQKTTKNNKAKQKTPKLMHICSFTFLQSVATYYLSELPTFVFEICDKHLFPSQMFSTDKENIAHIIRELWLPTLIESELWCTCSVFTNREWIFWDSTLKIHHGTRILIFFFLIGNKQSPWKVLSVDVCQYWSHAHVYSGIGDHELYFMIHEVNIQWELTKLHCFSLTRKYFYFFSPLLCIRPRWQITTRKIY